MASVVKFFSASSVMKTSSSLSNGSNLCVTVREMHHFPALVCVECVAYVVAINPNLTDQLKVILPGAMKADR